MRLDLEVELDGTRFSWGMASLPKGKTWGLCLTQLCAKYRLVSATLVLTISAER